MGLTRLPEIRIEAPRGEARRESRPGVMEGIAGEDGTGRVGSLAASEGYLPD